jgi:hypothetical protein
MSWITILYYVLGFGIGIIIVWLLCALIFWLYGVMEKMLIKRRIPDDLKKEVEDERRRKEQQRDKRVGTGNPEIERALESARVGNINQEPAGIQQASIGTGSSIADRSAEDKVRHQFDNRQNQRRKLDRI